MPAPSLADGDTPAAPVETFNSGDFALYIPANAPAVRGILLILGGPDTQAFVTGGYFGAPYPELESSLQQLGEAFRELAADQRMAILGTSLHGPEELPNQAETDTLLFDVITELALVSGHSELTDAPIFLYGISGGTPLAAGFAARNPGRTGALLLKVPAVPEPLSSPEALAIPTFVILAEEDKIMDNTAVLAVFGSNRRAGGLWAVAIQPGVPHHSLTPDHRAITVNWLRATMERRLGSGGNNALLQIPESSGWLGDIKSGATSWQNYQGDRTAASWFPSPQAAEDWWQFVTQ